MRACNLKFNQNEIIMAFAIVSYTDTTHPERSRKTKIHSSKCARTHTHSGTPNNIVRNARRGHFNLHAAIFIAQSQWYRIRCVCVTLTHTHTPTPARHCIVRRQALHLRMWKSVFGRVNSCNSRWYVCGAMRNAIFRQTEAIKERIVCIRQKNFTAKNFRITNSMCLAKNTESTFASENNHSTTQRWYRPNKRLVASFPCRE